LIDHIYKSNENKIDASIRIFSIKIIVDIYKFRMFIWFESKQAESIDWLKNQGFYASLTHDGKLVVDGILVSTYTTVANHQRTPFFMDTWNLSNKIVFFFAF